MSGPAPTPTKLRILTGDTRKGKRPISEREPDPPSGEPHRPPLRDKVSRQEWSRVTKLLLDMEVLSLVDGQALAIYCDTWSMYKEYELDVRKKGLMIPSSIRADGTVAMTCRNPAVASMEAARRDYMKYLCEFGMTPASRSKVQIIQKKKDAAAEFFDEQAG